MGVIPSIAEFFGGYTDNTTYTTYNGLRMSSNSFPRYYEDCEIGQTAALGSYTVTEEEITEFATKYDPQPFHTDKNEAKDSMFGGIIASGWQTAAICMRLFVDDVLEDMASAGGRGIDELRWYAPVRPGDVLSVQIEIIETLPLEDNPELGEVHVKLTGVNQNDELIISLTLLGMIERRESSRSKGVERSQEEE